MCGDCVVAQQPNEVNGARLVIAGLDADAGLSRVLGMRNIYEDVLQRFVVSQSGVVPEILSRYAEGGLVAARRAAHTLKGLAASLGAVNVASAAESVEEALVSGDDVYPPLARLAGRFALLAAAIEQALPLKSAENEADVANMSLVCERASALEALLAAGEADAAGYAKRHAGTLVSAYGPAMHAAIDAACGFRFDLALRVLRSVLMRDGA